MLKELSELADEVRLSFHAFADFARGAHGDRVDPSGRAVLEYLSKNPAATVPTIARSRGVTRQHIQTIVNDLDAKGLVQASANPAHQRSPLFSLSVDGQELIESISRTEQALLEPLMDTLDTGSLTAATETLIEVRELLAQLEVADD